MENIESTFTNNSLTRYYADLILGVLKMYEAHDDTVLDTSINRLRIETITHCKESIIKCQQITAAR